MYLTSNFSLKLLKALCSYVRINPSSRVSSCFPLELHIEPSVLCDNSLSCTVCMHVPRATNILPCLHVTTSKTCSFEELFLVFCALQCLMNKALYVIHFSILPLLGPVLATSLRGFPFDNHSLQLRAEYDAHVINFLVLVSTQSCVLLPALFPFHFVSRTHLISKYLSFSISTNSLHFPSILPTFQLG